MINIFWQESGEILTMSQLGTEADLQEPCEQWQDIESSLGIFSNPDIVERNPHTPMDSELNTESELKIVERNPPMDSELNTESVRFIMDKLSLLGRTPRIVPVPDAEHFDTASAQSTPNNAANMPLRNYPESDAESEHFDTQGTPNNASIMRNYPESDAKHFDARSTSNNASNMPHRNYPQSDDVIDAEIRYGNDYETNTDSKLSLETDHDLDDGTRISPKTRDRIHSQIDTLESSMNNSREEKMTPKHYSRNMREAKKHRSVENSSRTIEPEGRLSPKERLRESDFPSPFSARTLHQDEELLPSWS